VDWILGGMVLITIIEAARSVQIPPELILAIIEVESSGEAYAAKLNPHYPFTMPQAKRPAGVDHNTEIYMQKTAWGLMQVMGATARSAGFEGRLPELTDPAVNVKTGVAYLGTLMSKHRTRHGLEGVVAAYNGGAPRKRPDGKWVNQGYVDKVMKAMEKYKTVAEGKEIEAETEMKTETPEEPAAEAAHDVPSPTDEAPELSIQPAPQKAKKAKPGP
jgi:soluble lytic murein transglycosylase-like protein